MKRPALLLAAATLLAPLPAAAGVIEIEEGALYCTAYDRRTETCASISTAKIGENGRFTLVEVVSMKVGEMSFTMTGSTEIEEVEGRYCMIPGTHRHALTPEDSKMGKVMLGMVETVLEGAMVKGLCFEHLACGEDVLALAYVGEEPEPELSGVFTVFPPGDARVREASPRFMTMEEAREGMRQVEACMPEET